jgi:hypothetical protein
MSKNIFQFITPSQLTEKFRFSTRVLMSWAALGLGLGVIIGIVMISSGTSHSVLNDFLGCLFAVPIVICLFGLVGLGIDSMGGRDAYYDGWYWYLFPVVTYLLVGFWVAWSIIGFSLALAGVRLPKIPQKRPSQFNPEQFREEIENMKIEDLLQQFDEQFEQAENKNQLDQEEKKVIKKLRGLDRSALRSEIRNSLTNEERERLFLLLIKILSGEIG